jgi:hypothetical protein
MHEHYADTKAEVIFEIRKKCLYQCTGTLIKLVRFIEPYDHVKSFSFPKPKPVKPIKCSQ